MEPSYREKLRDAIVAKAGAIVEVEGLEAVQARRIAREAGCAVGTVYNLFGDIDGLIVAVNAETLSKLGGAIGGASRSADALPLEARLEGLALAYMRFALDNFRRWEAVFKHRLPPGREVPPSYVEDQDKLLAVIEAMLGSTVPEPAKRASTARALFGAVHGILALGLDNRLGGRVRGELEEQIRLIVRLAAGGLMR